MLRNSQIKGAFGLLMMGSKSFLITNLSLIFVFIISYVWDSRYLYAQTFPSDHRYADIDVDDCEGLWRLLWPDFLEGVQDSSVMLAILVLRRGLRVPRYSQDTPLVMRDAVFFMINSTYYSNITADFVVSFQEDIIPKYWSFFDDEYYEYTDCIERSANQSDCVEIAVDHNIIPSLRDFRSDIEASINAGAIPYCEDDVVGP